MTMNAEQSVETQRAEEQRWPADDVLSRDEELEAACRGWGILDALPESD
jgi:hypothetical protein